MTREEFTKGVDSLAGIETGYMYYPGITTKDAIVAPYYGFNMVLIKDLENQVRQLRMALDEFENKSAQRYRG